MKQPGTTLTPQELAIMKVVWSLESVTVRDVYDTLRAKRRIAYTTVMTMMKILEQKGYLTAERGEKAYVYRPARGRQHVLGGMVREFLDRVFDGASKPLLVHLIRTAKLSDKERKALRRAIDEVEE